MTGEDASRLDGATAAQLQSSLVELESQAYDELARLGASLFTDSVTGQPRSSIEHSMLYKSMAHGWPNVQELRRELAEMSDEALLSAGYLFDILNFVHWVRQCLARGYEAHALAATLERLSSVPLEDLVTAWKQAGGQKRGGAASTKRKAAAVKLLEKILGQDDGLKAKDVWHRAGSETYGYCHVDLDGTRYEFKKDENRNLAIFHVDPKLGRQPLRPQPFNSTFRRWCQQAKANLSSPPS